ncbi:TPA: hypothetical protein I9005_001833 [Clostridium perfringens]|nr:hypothetical protein [Clostridium perfringens]
MHKSFSRNFFKTLSEESRKEIIGFCDIKAIVKVIKGNKLEFGSALKGVKLSNISKDKIIELFNISIDEKKCDKLLMEIYRKLLLETEVVYDEIYKLTPEKILTNTMLSKDEELVKKVIKILLKSKFKNNILLFFEIEGFRITNKLKHRINEVVHEEELREEIFNEINKELNKDFDKILGDLKEEFKEKKNKFIQEKQELIKKNQELIKTKQKNEQELVEALKFEGIEREKAISNLEKKLRECENKALEYEYVISEKRNIIFDLEKKNDINTELINQMKKELCELKKIANSKIDELKIYADSEVEKIMINVYEAEEVYKIEKNKFVKLQNTENEKLNILKSECDKYKKDLEYLEEKFLRDIDKLKKFLGRDRLIVNEEIASKEKSNNEKIFVVDEEIKFGEFFEVQDLEDFQDTLENNFEKSGIINGEVNDFSKYIISILKNNKDFLLIGYNSRNIAHSIAATKYNQSAEIISYIDNSISPKELIENINKSSKKVILIENFIDNVSENIYLPLLKNRNKEKVLIFSMENSENIHLLNKCIFNYLIPVDIEYISNVSTEFEFMPSIFKLENIQIRNNDTNLFGKFIKKNKRLSNVVDNNLSNLATTIMELFDINKEIAIASIMKYTLYPILKHSNEENVFIDIYETKRQKLNKLEEFVDYVKRECDYDAD